MPCQLLGEVHLQFYASYDSNRMEEQKQHHPGESIVPKPYDVKVGDS